MAESKKGSFTVSGNDYLLNGKKFNIYSGAIHYFRVVPEYWEDRLLKLKACGFNTVETYVPWNAHETEKGQYDFDWILDIEKFIETAAKVGLYVIVRPGPYICAEWEFGGLPAWLLRDKNMRIRCMYEPYLNHVKDWYTELLTRLVPYQITNGGNIIAMQVENEYGSYGNDKEYLAWIEKLMLGLGIDVLLFTSDGPEYDMLSGGTLKHVHKTANFGSMPGSAFKKLRKFQPAGPMTCMEFWLGWFDHWQDKKHHIRPGFDVARNLKSIMETDGNFNVYMFHGGTNFGFWAGANHGKTYDPTVTSYDYDAPLNEWGGYTKKYHAVRKALLEHQGRSVAEEQLPPSPELQTIGKVALTESTSLFENLDTLGKTFESVTAETMENFGQNYGFIMYEHRMPEDSNYTHSSICFDKLADRAYVYLNDEYKGVAYRTRETSVKTGPLAGGDNIRVLVEAMGRVNYGPLVHDRKGIKRFKINNMQITTHFKITTIPMDDISKVDFLKETNLYPIFLKGKFRAEKKADTFVHLPGFTKGVIWINGFNLGRYWNAGPQKSLYLPGPLLKEENDIIVMELEKFSNPEIELLDYHKL